jgi:hypothetical protein
MDDTIRVKTSGEVWGVFYDNSPESLLVAVFEDEGEAEDLIRFRAEEAWDEAIGSGVSDKEAELKSEEVFDRYTVEPIPAEVVDYDLLLRGFAQKFIVRS